MRNRFRAQCWQKINRNQSEPPPLPPPPLPLVTELKIRKLTQLSAFIVVAILATTFCRRAKCEKDFWNNFLKFIAKLGTSRRAERQQLSDTVEHWRGVLSPSLSAADRRITWAECPRLSTNYSDTVHNLVKKFSCIFIGKVPNTRTHTYTHAYTHTRTVSFSSMLQCQGRRQQNREN